MQESVFPRKTKIATQFMKISGIFLFCVLFIIFLFGFIRGLLCFDCGQSQSLEFLCGTLIISPFAFISFFPSSPLCANIVTSSIWSIFGALILFILSRRITKKNKTAWILSIIFLFIIILHLAFITVLEFYDFTSYIHQVPLDMVITEVVAIFLRYLIYLPPFVFFLLDRKNFFKIAS